MAFELSMEIYASDFEASVSLFGTLLGHAEPAVQAELMAEFNKLVAGKMLFVISTQPRPHLNRGAGEIALNIEASPEFNALLERIRPQLSSKA